MDPRITMEPVTADRLVFTGKGWWYGMVILTTVTGGDVTVRDALDSGTGKSLGRYEGIADQSTPIIFTRAIPIDIGLFIDVGSSITSVNVLFRKGE